MSQIEAVTIPRWGMTMTEGTIGQWMIAEGDVITHGQEIMEIETTKVTNVVEAPAGGTVRRIVLQSGVTVPVGALAAVIADSSATEAEIDAFVESYASRLSAADEDQAGGAAPKLVPVEGGNVNLLEVGSGTDDAVLFLHGFGGDLSTWMFNQEPIAESHRTVAVDLPGHGMSTPAGGGDVVAGIAAAVKAAVEVVTPGKIHLIGHSFGGAVASAIAAASPSNVASVTLIAPVGLGKEINREFLVDFIEAERRRPLQKVLERLFADPSKITNDMVEGTLRFKRLEGVTEALTAIAGAIANDEGQVQSIGATLSALECPVMLIWGDQDAIVPLPDAGKVPANAELRVIPGTGHMPQMEAAAAVNDAIRENMGKAG